jgi:tripartite-type tricarboxylate transporter receptor subunit TctC
MLKRHFWIQAYLLGLIISCAVPALGQSYPAKPVRLIVPWPPVGSNDIAARILAPRMTKILGQTIVVDNRAGANGIIGSEIVAKATPDGYTIMLNSSTHVANASIFRELPYDTLKDFLSIAPVASVPTIVTIYPSLPVRTLQDLVAYARARPGRLYYSSGGRGGQTHLPTALFAKMAGIDIVHVAYKGGGPAIVAVLGGEVQLMIATMPSVIGHIKAGKLRALAVTSSQRSLLLPDLPTVAESGVAGYEMSAWLGVFAPAGLPGNLVGRLHDEIQRTLKLPDVAMSFSLQGMEPAFGTQPQFAAFVQAELKKYATMIKEFGAATE